MDGGQGRTDRDAELLCGHLAVYGELLSLLAEKPGLLLVAGDPLSGTSGLLAVATKNLPTTYVHCDARPCADALDLAMTIGDSAVAALAPEADAWWMGAAPPASAAGLRLSRTLGAQGVDLDELRNGVGLGLARLSDAIELVVALDPDAGLVIDHLGLLLAALPAAESRALLGELRAALQRHSTLDLILVEHSGGSMSKALQDRTHPIFQAGETIEIPRPEPERMVGDLAVARAWTDVPAGTLKIAAELARGVPVLTWRTIELSGGEEVLGGWKRLRELTEPSTAGQWDLLRRVHRQAQPIVASMGSGMRPHTVAANAKSINDALNRLRGLGVVWQPRERRWSLSDPLLASWVRENPSSWTSHLRQSDWVEPGWPSPS